MTDPTNPFSTMHPASVPTAPTATSASYPAFPYPTVVPTTYYPPPSAESIEGSGVVSGTETGLGSRTVGMTSSVGPPGPPHPPFPAVPYPGYPHAPVYWMVAPTSLPFPPPVMPLTTAPPTKAGGTTNKSRSPHHVGEIRTSITDIVIGSAIFAGMVMASYYLWNRYMRRRRPAFSSLGSTSGSSKPSALAQVTSAFFGPSSSSSTLKRPPIPYVPVGSASIVPGDDSSPSSSPSSSASSPYAPSRPHVRRHHVAIQSQKFPERLWTSGPESMYLVRILALSSPLDPTPRTLGSHLAWVDGGSGEGGGGGARLPNTHHLWRIRTADSPDDDGTHWRRLVSIQSAQTGQFLVPNDHVGAGRSGSVHEQATKNVGWTWIEDESVAVLAWIGVRLPPLSVRDNDVRLQLYDANHPDHALVLWVPSHGKESVSPTTILFRESPLRTSDLIRDGLRIEVESEDGCWGISDALVVERASFADPTRQSVRLRAWPRDGERKEDRRTEIEPEYLVVDNTSGIASGGAPLLRMASESKARGERETEWYIQYHPLNCTLTLSTRIPSFTTGISEGARRREEETHEWKLGFDPVDGSLALEPIHIDESRYLSPTIRCIF